MDRRPFYLMHSVSAVAAVIALASADLSAVFTYRHAAANRPTPRRKRWAKSHTPRASRLIRRAFGRSQPC